MDIICARTGRHFNSVEAARECSREHNHCNACSYDKKSDNPIIHFVSESGGAKARREIDKLMASISGHLEATKAKPAHLKTKGAKSSCVEGSVSMDNREANAVGHPPACTCADCIAKRLQKQGVESDGTIHASHFSEIPIRKVPPKTPRSPSKPLKKLSKFRIPKWLFALLLIFALSLIGLGLNALVGSPIPLWLLLGFSVIYSIEKWFNYFTRKSKALGKLYRLVLNLGILSILGLLIWSGFQLVAKQLAHTPLTGSLVFLAEFVFFVWMWRKVAKNSWRWPSMKLTVFLLVCIAVVFAFAGVPPLSTYKDTLITKWEDYQTKQAVQQAEREAEAGRKAEEDQVIKPPTETSIPEPPEEDTKLVPNSLDPKAGTYQNYYLGLIYTPGGVVSGSNCYGDFIVLINNSEAKNPTYSELLIFLKTDETDKFPYQPTLSVIGFYYGKAEDKIKLGPIKNIIDGLAKPLPPRICADFAERLHNNAEIAGIRAGYVSLDLMGYTDPANLGIPSNSGHALNVFETVDRGLVFIDSTGPLGDYGPLHGEATTNLLEVGQPYNLVFVFPTDWIMPEGQMGTITNILITWDGEWR